MRIAIIGGSGNMGRWLARFLRDEGMEVSIAGRDAEKLQRTARELDVAGTSSIEAVKTADVVVISVPPAVFEPVVKEIAPYTREGQIIIDVTSVKTTPVAVMHRYIKKSLILGTHPVFGPGARSLVGQNIVLTPTNDTEANLGRKVNAYLTQKKASVTIMTPEAHDETMTVVLGLAHFIAIVAADTLLGFDNFNEMKKIGGTTFKLLYTLVESVISEDPQLYASLQTSFPGASKIEGQFIRNARQWAAMVEKGDAGGFAVKMQGLRDKLEKTDPSFRQAYDNMYRVNEILNRKDQI